MPIDYARMQKAYPRQKSALTRAEKSGDRARIVRTVAAAVVEWNAIGCWPDGWHRWNNALQDAAGFGRYVDIDSLADVDYVAELVESLEP